MQTIQPAGSEIVALGTEPICCYLNSSSKVFATSFSCLVSHVVGLQVGAAPGSLTGLSDHSLVGTESYVEPCGLKPKGSCI
ncbi:hypothetical protein ASPBRDRAFT_506879 [Aspergillus brasiliensis CBS 101740]|uniref:Uncharacterized protein n=1 Tax=Aspergillus brasiliensis (strain CBS 101740 / IMI 381727 / IBT 21946) TaxID=767769 RepID=A0A1L9UPG3_ASPBC|nr:hypothetical protein ASPBRDRAFT_506879 [Aspergillus brasiliensis CBS 101740]